MKTPAKLYKSATRLFAVILLTAMMGCGGGGGGTASAPAVGGATPTTTTPPPASTGGGYGKIAASVKFTPPASANRDAQATGMVTVTLKVTGVYALDNKEFPPITTTVTIDMSQGPAKVQVLSVPIGKHHLFTATADFGSGNVQEIKAIVPEITEGELTSFTADQATTAVANTAVYVAEKNDKKLIDITSEEMSSYALAVSSMYIAGAAYASITPQSVLGFIANIGVPATLTITPATATVMAGQSYQFTATLKDLNGTAMTGSLAWAVSSSSLGSVNSSGLLTAVLAGTGTVSVSSGTLSASAAVTVIATCAVDAQCEEGNPLTLDTCANPGAANATCAHTAFACNTGSDCATSAPFCINGGTLSAACIACNTTSDCNDGNPLTVDACSNGGAVGAACSNAAFACNTSSDCAVSNPYCVNGGGLTAVCAVCTADSECDDTNALTVDACVNPGLSNSSCGHTAVACAVDLDCDDSNILTQDLCSAGGTLSASCSHPLDATLTPQLLSSVAVGSGYYNDIVYSILSRKLFAIDDFDNTIMTYDMLNTTNSVISGSPDFFYRLIKDPASEYVYALARDSALTTFTYSKIDISSETVVGTIPISSGNYSGPGSGSGAGSGSGCAPLCRKAGHNRQAAKIAAGKTAGTTSKQTRRAAGRSSNVIVGGRSSWGAPTAFDPEIFGPRNELYTANIDENTYNTHVSVIDLSTFTEVAYIDTGSYSYYDYYYAGIPIDNSSQILYSVNNMTSLGRYDLNANASLAPSAISWSGNMYKMTERRVGAVSYLYAVTSSNLLEIYNLDTDTLVCSVPGASGSGDYATIGIYDPLNHVYVNDGSNVSVYNGTDCAYITTLTGEYPMFGFAYDETLGQVYLSHGTNSISVYQYAPPPGP